MNKQDRIKLLFILILTLYFLFTMYFLLTEDNVEHIDSGNIKKAQETNQYY